MMSIHTNVKWLSGGGEGSVVKKNKSSIETCINI